MNNKKNKLLLFTLLGILILVFCGFFAVKFYNKKNNNTVKKDRIIIDNNDDSTTSKNYNTWNSDTAYNKDDIVEYENKLYKAKWWTKGEQPGSSEWGAWELIEDVKNDSTTSNDEDDTGYTPSGENLSNSSFRVVGYFPEWKPDKEKYIQYDKLTHINYAFAIPNSDGSIKQLDNPDLAEKVIKKGHSNGIKVLLAVGGWEYNGKELERTFVEATDSDSKCEKLANDILSLVDKYGFDGVDMDWEHPRTDGNSKNQYASLLKYLQKGLKKDDKLLTAAVQPGVNAEGQVSWDAAGHLDSALACLDWINVMAYDGGDGDRHSSFDFAKNSINYWKNTRKLPANKVVLGVPFYGRPSWASYEDILKADSSAYKKDVATIDGKEAHYNGIDTIKKKTEFAKENVSGIMIWEISQDTTDIDKSLLNAIYETIK